MGKSKLETTGRLMESECKAQCVWRDCKRQRRIMSRLRGHWQLKWEGFTDKVLKMGPFMLRCKYLEEQRSRKERLMIDRVDGWNELGGDCDG